MTDRSSTPPNDERLERLKLVWDAIWEDPKWTGADDQRQFAEHVYKALAPLFALSETGMRFVEPDPNGTQAAVASSAGERSEPQGTTACPVCGLDTPHWHDVDAVNRERVERHAFEKSYTELARAYPDIRVSGWGHGFARRQEKDEPDPVTYPSIIPGWYERWSTDSFAPIKGEYKNPIIQALWRLWLRAAETRTPVSAREARELERLRERVAEVEEAEGRCCPEDVGFEEYIGVLERRIGERDVTIANQVTAINAMNVATSAREAMSAVAALDTVIASMKEASERRYQVAQEAEREAHKWKAEGDMYGWNYHAGRAGGGHECDIIYFRALREAEDLRKKLATVGPGGVRG